MMKQAIRTKEIVFLLVFLLLLPCISAKQLSMKLLAVKETEKGYEGSPADLFLEIKPGSGKVFLDTFPLTKLDTQISTRFAKEIACSHINAECDNFDFIYTIKADSSIIGGPSAGAAIAALTISALNGFAINKEVTVTGTINSGGLIGPVGGLKAKVDAASESAIKKVLVTKGALISENLTTNTTKTNLTENLFEYGKEKGIEIKEVSTIDEVVYELTGTRLKEVKGELIINKDYEATMKGLASILCNRSSQFSDKIKSLDISDEINSNITNGSAFDLYAKGKNAFENNLYYSSASYCFGSNVRFNYLYLKSANLSQRQILDKIYLMRNKLNNFTNFIDNQEIETITDLESYMTVKDRLIDAKEFLDKSWFALNESNTSLYNLAYATERIFSAYSWAYFFDHRGKKYSFDKEALKDSCLRKISEVEERVQYILLEFPIKLEETRKGLNYAYNDLENGNYELCLFEASKAKASVNVFLNLIGVEEDMVQYVINKKMESVKQVLIKHSQKGIFPVLGYSYYEYANSLKENDKYSALLYSEYAFELSNLDMYFKQKQKIEFNVSNKDILLVLSGLFTGALIGVFLRRRKTS